MSALVKTLRSRMGEYDACFGEGAAKVDIGTTGISLILFAGLTWFYALALADFA